MAISTLHKEAKLVFFGVVILTILKLPPTRESVRSVTKRTVAI